MNEDNVTRLMGELASAVATDTAAYVAPEDAALLLGLASAIDDLVALQPLPLGARFYSVELTDGELRTIAAALFLYRDTEEHRRALITSTELLEEHEAALAHSRSALQTVLGTLSLHAPETEEDPS